MSIPLAEQRILQIKSGNRCAFPACAEPMIKKTAFGTRETLIGEMAHIVSETTDGPRGKHALDAGEHNKYPNLMLLCTNHHTEVDAHEEIDLPSAVRTSASSEGLSANQLSRKLHCGLRTTVP